MTPCTSFSPHATAITNLASRFKKCSTSSASSVMRRCNIPNVWRRTLSCSGEAKKLSIEELRHLELGALLHDIGKIAIPHNVLMKAGPLNDEEWGVMKLHPQIGWELLSEFPELGAEAEIVHSHHERFDGKGYPRGLKAHDIPLGSRIFSIVDTLDAITSDRPYRGRQPIEAARAEIKKSSGSQFDPSLAAAMDKLPHSALLKVRFDYPDAENPQ